MFENIDSQRKTRPFKNMNFLGTNQVRSNPREGKEDLGRVIKRERAQVVVGEGGVEAGGGEAAGAVEKGEEVTLLRRLLRARTKPRGAITTGNEATTRRWQGRGLHLDDIMIPIRCRTIRTDSHGRWIGGRRTRRRYLEKHILDFFLGTVDDFDQVVCESHICDGRRISSEEVGIDTVGRAHRVLAPC